MAKRGIADGVDYKSLLDHVFGLLRVQRCLVAEEILRLREARDRGRGGHEGHGALDGGGRQPREVPQAKDVKKMNELNNLLTIVIPVKNEEINLPACLENIKAFTHVVVVDSESTDRTLEIAAEYEREVVHFKWNGLFPKKRNWLLRNYKFKTTWVMFLDADERITEGWLKEAEIKLCNSPANVDAWICYYDNWFMNRMLRHGDVMRKTAILRIGHGEYEHIEENNWSSLDMEIHEHLQVKGRIAKIRARLEHHDKRSLESYHKKHDEYANWEANRYKALKGDFSPLTRRQKIKYNLIGRPWFGFVYFFVCFILKCGFLDGRPGYVFALEKMRYFRNIWRKLDK